MGLFDHKSEYTVKDVDCVLQTLVVVIEEQKKVQKELDKLILEFSIDSLGF